jgi:hypothetical protein
MPWTAPCENSRKSKDVKSNGNPPLVRNTSPLLLAILIRKPSVLPLGTRLARNQCGVVTCLHTETSRKHELADSGTETAQEGVEGL